MPIQYYIHNKQRETDITSKFGNEFIKRQYEMQKARVNSALKAYTSQYGEIFKDVRDYKKFLENLSANLTTQVGSTVGTQLSNMQFGSIVGQTFSGKNIAASIIKLQQQLSGMRKTFEEAEKILNDSKNQLSALENNPSIPTPLTQKELERLIKASERIIKHKEAFERFAGMSADAGNYGDLATLRKIALELPIAGGFIAEYLTTAEINKIEELLESMGNLSGIKVTAKQAGARSGKTAKGTGYNVATEDVKLSVSDGIGNLSVSIPGLSVKRTTIRSVNGQRYVKFRAKTSSLGNLIANSKYDASTLSTFYNAFANHNKPYVDFDDPEQPTKVVSIKGMASMYNSMHYSFLLTALSGAISKEDFAYFIMINDKVYTILDILNASNEKTALLVGAKGASGANILNALNTDSVVGTSLNRTSQAAIAKQHRAIFNNLWNQKNGRSMQELGDLRSQEIMQAIQGLQIVLDLNLQLT